MVIYPKHEQHFPTMLLQRRLEEYVLPDGRPPTTDRRFAQRVTGQQVLEAVVKAQATLSLTSIDPRYFVGTCFHEAGCANEWDTEVATASCPPGYVSVGAYQIGDEEARRYGFALEDMLDLDKSTTCMVRLAEDNRRGLRAAAGLADDKPDPDYTDSSGTMWQGGTMRAYLAIAHNMGMGAARLSIQRYGMDWSAYKLRNPMQNVVDHHYGEDCVTGGPFWPTRNQQPRLLLLTNPRMTGDDVAELQAQLTKAGFPVAVDNVFGPATDMALRGFQRAAGLFPDGKCGQQTRAALAAHVG